MINRAYLSKCVSIVTLCVALVVLWQVVRFCQGKIGAPGFDEFANVIFKSGYGAQAVLSNAGGPFTDFFKRAFFAVGGIFTWLFIFMLVSSLGSATARIAEVGLKRYRMECKAAAEEARRWADIEADREQRRELRRKRREAQQPKASFDISALLLGILIGILIGKIF